MTTVSRLADLPERPASSADEQVGVNGAIAAALTRIVGSMPTLYVVLAIVGGWMALATWGPLRRIDPFPFPFLLFLNNVVQLVLCLVILVGQRVLGLAADRRAVQTYEHAEAIFAQVADLQEHLDRQDRTLSRGVSLLQTSPHPWIRRHRVQPPPQAVDQAVSVNGRIAAWLTARLGSMWAFYVAVGTQVVWIGLAEARLQRLDPYPFAFMTFLSTLAQLVFMVVIMVGQDVVGRAADRRSEQTFLDAEAILHECRRMKARLTAQDRVIDSLSDYTTQQVTEHLAQAIHASHVQAAIDDGETLGSRPELQPWDALPPQMQDASRVQARQIGERLAAIGCLMVPTFDPTLTVTLTDDEVHLLARLEHAWQTSQDAERAEVDLPAQRHPALDDLVAWDRLPHRARAEGLQLARGIPAMLAGVGFQVLRVATGTAEGDSEKDFTLEEWGILQQAIMASGVLVSLAEGVADADEIFALVRKLRETSLTHPNPFIRELAASSTFTTGLHAGSTYADYEGPALETIRSATAVVARKTPANLSDFRAFLDDLAATVADANKEGGFFGLGARPRTRAEAEAMRAVSRATDGAG